MASREIQNIRGTDKLQTFYSTTEMQILPTQTEEMFTDLMYYYFELFMFNILGSLIAVFGVVANVINVVVYYEQGVKDSVTVTFIALSLWDLGNCFTSLLSIFCFIIENHYPKPSINLLAVQYAYFGYTRGFMYVLSTIVTAYLSVERCICIVIPFKVKGIFTKSRSLLTNFVIVVFSAACFCPAWATQGLQWRFDIYMNRSRLVLWLAKERRDVDIFVDTVNGIVTPTIAQAVITVSAILMISAIKTSATFRQKAAGSSIPVSGKSSAQNLTTSDPAQGSNTTDKAMSSKDSKLTKVVVLVAIIFFICNFPVLIVALVRALVPELDIGKKYNNLYYVAYIFVYDFGLINSSINILVYYSVSTRFKEVFLSLFLGGKH